MLDHILTQKFVGAVPQRLNSFFFNKNIKEAMVWFLKKVKNTTDRKFVDPMRSGK